MHLAADRLPASVLPKIKAVVMFGDPNNKLGLLGQFRLALRARAVGICAPNDPVSLCLSVCLFVCLQGACGRLMSEMARFAIREIASIIT